MIDPKDGPLPSYKVGASYVRAQCDARDSWLEHAIYDAYKGGNPTGSIKAALYHDRYARQHAAQWGVIVPDIPERFLPILVEWRLTQ